MPDLLSAWETFYLIIGTAGAALTGLQFVVIVLGAETNMIRGGTAVSAFATPTIVHFGAVLLISSILSAPWHALGIAALLLAVSGVFGAVYTMSLVRHARRQNSYAPVLEDWLWHFTFPPIAYIVLLLAALFLRSHPVGALFWIGATAVFLLFIGIHNAWDAVVYMAQRPRERAAESDEAAPPL